MQKTNCWRSLGVFVYIYNEFRTSVAQTAKTTINRLKKEMVETKKSVEEEKVEKGNDKKEKASEKQGKKKSEKKQK